MPWRLTQAQLSGADEQLRASAAGIISTLAAVLADAIARRTAPSCRALAAPAAAALLGATIVAVATWADAGANRGALAPRIDEAIAPVVAGYGAALTPLG